MREIEASAADLAALQSRIATASPAGLAQLRNQVVALATNAKTEAQRVIGTAAARESEATQELATARENARHQVELTMSTLRGFDPYLRFTSKDDEETYRKREAESRRAIDAELAKHTAGGDLTANALAIRQLRDAGRHGADASPDFAATNASLQKSYRDLRQSMAATGQSTEAQDRIAGFKVDTAPASSTPEQLGSVLATLRNAGVTTGQDDSLSHGLADKLGHFRDAAGRQV